MNHGGSSINPAVKEATDRGTRGFMAVHYGVEVNKGEQGQQYLEWLGGYFEPFWSVNPHWTPDFNKIPKHETTRRQARSRSTTSGTITCALSRE